MEDTPGAKLQNKAAEEFWNVAHENQEKPTIDVVTALEEVMARYIDEARKEGEVSNAKQKDWTFKDGTPKEPRNQKDVVHDFTVTNTPGEARREIYKFLEAAGLVLTQRQLVILTAMLKHHKNVSITSVNKRIQEVQDEIRALRIKYGEEQPTEKSPRKDPVVKGVCSICGQPLPEGEEMFMYHGYSGNCPTPPTKASE